MKTSRYVALAAAAALMPLIAGCQTATDQKSIESNVRVNKGAYNGSGSPIAGDIKSILMAGGLDAANPSAPTSSTSRSEIAKSQAQASTDTLVAALSDSSAVTATTVAAAQTPAPAVETRKAALARPARSEPKAATELALAEPASAREKKVATIFETRIDVDKQPARELPSINATDSPVVADTAFSVAYPLPESMAAAKPDTPAVDKPMPTAPVSKTARPPQVATSDDASQKKARIRRF